MNNPKLVDFDGFKPTPKRFMVWDKKTKSFCQSMNNDGCVFELPELAAFLMLHAGGGRPCTDFEFFQSTNLFDKDGKEIFEGTVVDNGACRAVCYWDKSNAELDFKMVKGDDLVKSWLDEYKIIGHALSNPGLLENR